MEINQMTYTAALEELEQINKALASDEISVDELAEKVERGVLLTEYCRAKLQDTDAKVKGIFEKLEQKEG
jgi:exodeoxyribonuclease VII small subunit